MYAFSWDFDTDVAYLIKEDSEGLLVRACTEDISLIVTPNGEIVGIIFADASSKLGTDWPHMEEAKKRAIQLFEKIKQNLEEVCEYD